MSQAFATFVAAAASRYNGKIGAIEIWNEANNPTFWQPVPNAADYTAMLKATYAAVKLASPAVTVVSTGVAPGSDTQGGGWMSPVTFLQAIYTDGGGQSFDAVGWHPYTWPADPSTNDPALAWSEMVSAARQQMISHGDGSKQIWVTEFGVPTCTSSSRCVSESTQAVQLQSAFTMWSSYSWAGPFIVYTPVDTCSDETNPECYFGLATATGRSKPALTIFSNYAASL